MEIVSKWRDWMFCIIQLAVAFMSEEAKFCLLCFYCTLPASFLMNGNTSINVVNG